MFIFAAAGTGFSQPMSCHSTLTGDRPHARHLRFRDLTTCEDSLSANQSEIVAVAAGLIAGSFGSLTRP